MKFDDRLDRQAIFLGEFEIPFIVCRNAHDRAVAVTHEHVISNPQWDLCVAEGVAHEQSGRHALFFLGGKLLLNRRTAFAFLDECSQLLVVARRVGRQRMFRRHRAKRHAHDGVGARGKGIQHAALADVVRESQAHALAAADPIGLHGAHPLGPLGHAVQGIEQIFGIRRDLQVVHGDFALFDQRAGPPAPAIDDLLVGQHRFVGGVPIHHTGFLVRDALFQHAQEQPLVPAIIIWKTGRELAAPIQAVAERL